MRSHSLYTILIALAAIVLIGCTAAGNKVTKIGQSPTVSQKATPETVVSDGAPRITIAELQDDHFAIAVIPKTWEVTNFSHLQPGDEVNLEVDVIAKYVERIMLFRN